MHRRPKLLEAIEVLESLTDNEDALQAIVDYNDLKASGQEFLAARTVVDIVDHYYHLRGIKNSVHA